MKALTLWQPWASLMIGGFKAYETRSWCTEYRGWLAIHAAANVPKEVREFLHPWMNQNASDFWTCLKAMGYEKFDDLPHGVVIGVVKIDAIYRTETTRDKIDSLELAFGDWSDGRYAWRTDMLETISFSEPVPAKGRQGLWEWSPPDWVIEALD